MTHKVQISTPLSLFWRHNNNIDIDTRAVQYCLLGITVNIWSDIHNAEYSVILHIPSYIQPLNIMHQKVKVVRLAINHIKSCYQKVAWQFTFMLPYILIELVLES